MRKLESGGRFGYQTLIPAVFLRGKNIRVGITNYNNGLNQEGVTKTFEYPIIRYQWYTLQLEQRQTGPEASVFEFSVDGNLNGSQATLNHQYENVKLYLSNPWDETALDNVEVKNILIWNGAGEFKSYRILT